MTLGKGSPYSICSKQKINARSSTEAELIGVNDAMALIIWTRLFIEAQGYKVKDNVVYQDNQSAMLLENNGKRSSSKKTRHIEIRYFFVTDNIKRKQMRVEYCPTDEMTADFLTKPLQGSKFREFRKQILNLEYDFVDHKSTDGKKGISSIAKVSEAERQECVVNTIKTRGNTRVKDRVRWTTNVDNHHRDMITRYRSTRYRLRDKQ